VSGARAKSARRQGSPIRVTLAPVRAMSTRRHIHTRSWPFTQSRKRASPAVRPACPITRQCIPIDIIFGEVAPSA
jgi:hypothetical protein